MADSTIFDFEAAAEGEQDRLDATATSYASFFPAAQMEAFRAHLAVVRTGTQLARSVTSFLANRYGINRARYSLLRALYFAEGRRLSLSDLARNLAVTSPNVSQLIDALETDGLVERVVCDEDRRIVFAQLTASGVDRCLELVPVMAAFMQGSCSLLSEAEMRQLVTLLAKFRLSLQTVTSDEN